MAEPDKSSIPIGELIAHHEAGHAVVRMIFGTIPTMRTVRQGFRIGTR